MSIYIKYMLLILGVSFWGVPGCRQTGIAEESAQNPATATNQTGKKVKVESPGKIYPPSPAEQNLENPIAPNYCRVIGQVVSILPTLEKDKKDPCGKVPCQAKVKVKKVIGYGSAFGLPLGEGTLIKVTFSFTLQATQKYFPELTTPLPGLKAGQTFQADIREVEENKTKAYQVNEYQVK